MTWSHLLWRNLTIAMGNMNEKIYEPAIGRLGLGLFNNNPLWMSSSPPKLSPACEVPSRIRPGEANTASM